MNGIICIDKPSGITSFDVVAKMKRLLKFRKIGHAGTLDPMATGVLPLFIGSATRAVDRLPHTDKRYIATVKLGITTDTGDITGKILSRNDSEVDIKAFKEALAGFKGQVTQVPPMYSALKVNGQRLYDLARQGIVVERQQRNITIYDISLLSADLNKSEFVIEVLCSKGTYIRTLCEDIGKKLGCGATMASLRRTMAAGFCESDCISLEKAEQLHADNKLADMILDVETVYNILPEIHITDKQTVRFVNGGSLYTSRIENCPLTGTCRVKSQDDVFLGIGRVDEQTDEIKVECLFSRGGKNGDL